MSTRPTKQPVDGTLPSIEDANFLMREEMRSHRLALEFERAELGLQDFGVKSTIVVFGSSRIGEQELAASDENGGAQNSSLSLAGCYSMARDFARIVSERGGALSPDRGGHENVITTGGGPGIMEAANRGAAEAGAPTIGMTIELPGELALEQPPNEYITPGLSFHFRYFAVRKMHFAMRANALTVFPGGFGTLDELFEVLTLIQTRKASGMPVLLFCSAYWQNVINFDALVELGTVSPEDLELFHVVDSAEEGWQALMDRGLAISTPLREE